MVDDDEAPFDQAMPSRMRCKFWRRKPLLTKFGKSAV
jgi:hypothetical protein